MIALVHLVWQPLGLAPFESFVSSLERFDAGEEYRLVVVFNGFSDLSELNHYRHVLRGNDVEEVVLPKPQFDLAAYRSVAQQLNDEQICFMNSHSAVVANGWLRLLASALALPSVELVGGSGSWGSHRSFMLNRLGFPSAYRHQLGSRQTVSSAFSSASSPGSEPTLFGRLASVPGELVGFDGFPAPHVRTNAFLVDRDFFLGLEFGKLDTKRATHRLESGVNSFSTQILRAGSAVAVVGRHGPVLDWRRWPEANVFWQGDQQDLLISDNQTRAYDRANLTQRASMSAFAWGEMASPSEPARAAAGTSPVVGRRETSLAGTSFTEKCNNCGGSLNHSFIVGDLNRGIGTEQFQYLKCQGCGTYSLKNVPSDLSLYYPESYYELPEAYLLPALASNEAHKIEMIAPWKSGGRMVEVGPGAGVFSYCAKQAGFEVTAVEMDERTCEYMKASVGVKAVQGDDPALELRRIGSVSVVALWHVIEHLRDPWGFIDAAAECLEPGGILALSAPNPESVQFRLLGSRWAHVDAPRHLFLIPLSAIAERASRAGLRLVYSTTGDPSGRHWNRFGWEMAMRGDRRAGPSGRLVAAASLGTAVALRPLEGTALRGAAYSAIFVKESEPS